MPIKIILFQKAILVQDQLCFTPETYICKAYEEINFDKLTTLETFCVKLIHCEN